MGHSCSFKDSLDRSACLQPDTGWSYPQSLITRCGRGGDGRDSPYLTVQNKTCLRQNQVDASPRCAFLLMRGVQVARTTLQAYSYEGCMGCFAKSMKRAGDSWY